MARKFITLKWPIDQADKILEVLDRTVEDLAYLTEGYYDDMSDPGHVDLKFFKELTEKVRKQIEEK